MHPVAFAVALPSEHKFGPTRSVRTMQALADANTGVVQWVFLSVDGRPCTLVFPAALVAGLQAAQVPAVVQAVLVRLLEGD